MNKFLVLLLCALLFAGCTTTGSSGTVAPPSPDETKILSRASVGLIIGSQKKFANPEKLAELRMALLSVRNIMVGSLGDSAIDVEAVTLEAVKNLDPMYQEAVLAVVQLTMLRVQPLIDTEVPDLGLASTYIGAAVDGALGAVTAYEQRLDST